MRSDRSSGVRQALQRAGYELIQSDAGSAGDIGADLVAWASDATGELVPWAVIQVKDWGSGRRTRPELGLPVLSRARSALGTHDHYVVANGEWFKADAGLRRLNHVDGPSSPPHGTRGQVSDVSRATDLLRDSLLRRLSEARGSPKSNVDLFWPQLVEVRGLGVETESGQPLSAGPEVNWEARRRALVEFAASSNVPALTSHQVVAKALAALAGERLEGEVFDPFCGTGSFLWEAIETAHERGIRLQGVLGWDIDEYAVNLARSIASAAPVRANIARVDAFNPPTNDPASSVPLSDVVLSAPPIGRLAEPHEMLDGTHVREMEFAAVDLAIRALGEGGRAVIHLPRSFAFQNRSERYRAFLVQNYRVAALIGLPAGAVPGTQISSILVVIDNAPPGETFVAQLGSDWQAQLDQDGAALRAAVAHINGAGGTPETS